ncbi:uncharacterized protein LOC129608536 [Condylostylus longicornis]|uniref:uncharacterized protein LOC129608536 n=1 Tax=Condylostylus longicornis TaxID=2530218 RepID=UPI00244DB883|nr:uncharacterized protein LOC129608536 [Condylostylus longicornis]
MTVFSNETNEAVRDCTFDKGDCDKECNKCHESGCNTKNIIYQSCYQCNSSIKGEEECANIVQGLESKLCQAEIQTYDRRGCYVLKKGKSVKRGCAYELNDVDFELCQQDNNKTCSYCPEMKCNNKKPNLGSRILIHNKIYGFLLLLLIKIQN